jgi:hypothetical protein
MTSVDTATLELLAAWKAEDATTDPEGVPEDFGLMCGSLLLEDHRSAYV